MHRSLYELRIVLDTDWRRVGGRTLPRQAFARRDEALDERDGAALLEAFVPLLPRSPSELSEQLPHEGAQLLLDEAGNGRVFKARGGEEGLELLADHAVQERPARCAFVTRIVGPRDAALAPPAIASAPTIPGAGRRYLGRSRP